MSPPLPSKFIRLEAPAAEVDQRSIVRLQSLLIQEFEAKERQAEAEAALERCRRECVQLQEEIFRCRAMIAFVRMLPISVLTYIFEFLVAVSPDSIAQVNIVCKRWRKASELPRLWSTLRLGEDDREQRKAALFLQKSGSVPLDVTYVQTIPNMTELSGYNEVLPWKAWNSICSVRRRLSSLDLEFHDYEAARYCLWTLNNAPDLENLTLRVRGQSAQPFYDGYFGLDVPGNGCDTFSSFFPRLHSLDLYTFILPPMPGSIFHQLTTLHIYDTFSKLTSPQNNPTPMNVGSILKVLSNCASLQEFAFNGGETYHWYEVTAPDPGTPMIHHPFLRRLNLECHFFVGQCIMKNLTAFHLEYASLKLHPRHQLDGNDSLLSTATRFLKSTPKICSLHILGLHLTADLIGSFHNLEKLELDYTATPMLNDIFSKLAYLPRRHTVWPAPKLHSIKVRTQLDTQGGNDTVPIRRIAHFVKTRCLSNKFHGSPTAMTELIINNRDMLTCNAVRKSLRHYHRHSAPGELDLNELGAYP